MGRGSSLALVRLPAGDPSRRIGSLILGAGGPEESGADIVRAFGRFLGTEELRARFDLVGFDPRGIDRSTPLRCFDTLAEAQAAQAPFRLRSRPRRSAPGSGPTAGSPVPARHGGPILDHMTANVARDLDLLRQALGDRFPGKVRALALDAVIDSDRLVDRTWSAFAAVNGATRAHRDAPPQVTPG